MGVGEQWKGAGQAVHPRGRGAERGIPLSQEEATRFRAMVATAEYLPRHQRTARTRRGRRHTLRLETIRAQQPMTVAGAMGRRSTRHHFRVRIRGAWGRCNPRCSRNLWAIGATTGAHRGPLVCGRVPGHSIGFLVAPGREESADAFKVDSGTRIIARIVCDQCVGGPHSGSNCGSSEVDDLQSGAVAFGVPEVVFFLSWRRDHVCVAALRRAIVHTHIRPPGI